ncbi:MAG: SRPBCC domain-containing protein [Steroidobacteraceae bacterium]|jgi:uncharacterized protein YndB with AHSA1/START domain|nr:SRPBCC domain-containing protein [Steroidobacteraceae bacterium]
MRSATRGYVQVLETPAPAGALWQALTDPTELVAWHAEQALVEARLGGRYSVRSRLFGAREASIDLLEPMRRLRLIYDPAPSWPPLGDTAVVEDFVIDERKGRRVLRVLGSGVPAAPDWDAWHRRLQAGWAVAFAQLARRLEAPAS